VADYLTHAAAKKVFLVVFTVLSFILREKKQHHEVLWERALRVIE
jgi:hypothetical protein